MEGKGRLECFGEGRGRRIEMEEAVKKKMGEGEEDVENGADPCGLEKPQVASYFINGQ